MELMDKLTHFQRIFCNAGHLYSSSQNLQEKHAVDVQKWLNVTENLFYLSPKERNFAEDIFDMALKSSRGLFLMGDEVTAWVGQQNIARAAEKFTPGVYAAHNLGVSARYALYQVLLDEAESSLINMQTHFTEAQHPMAAQYWELRGMLLGFRKQYKQAIPCFILAREHVENCLATELKRWMNTTRNNLMGHENLRIVDCMIKIGWNLEGADRNEWIREIRKYLSATRNLVQGSMLNYLMSLNEVELYLLEDNLESAKTLIDTLLDEENIKSRNTSVLHPGAYMMKAGVADIEGDQRAMISYMSRALSESTLMFPDVMQELQVVDYALTLIRRNAMTRKQWKPLMEAMVLMLEAKDWYTGRNHSKSVARTSINLWKGWKKTEDDPAFMDDLYWAGYLHDIGKLMLPRSLLNKIAPLGESEWRIIRRHPTFSREMLTSICSDHVTIWTGEHHQDVSGSGYPGHEPASDPGLCIAVADILEAATSPDRKYQKPLTLQEIIGFLKAKGNQKFPIELLEVADNL